jgi:hypothetical protein
MLLTNLVRNTRDWLTSIPRTKLLATAVASTAMAICAVAVFVTGSSEVARLNPKPLSWEPPAPSQILQWPEIDLTGELPTAPGALPKVRLTVRELEKIKLDCSAKVIRKEGKDNLFALYVQIKSLSGPGVKRAPLVQSQMVGRPNSKGVVHFRGQIAAPRLSGEYRASLLFQDSTLALKPLAEQSIQLTVVPVRAPRGPAPL